MRKILCAALLVVLIPALTFAQAPRQPNAAEIQLKLKKLNFLGSVLYVAAHPDDENTRVITYMANGRQASAAYLSLTRGDGGQNLIGSEIRDQLGLIRTQELLAARRIDGGVQFFTRAKDFGYSKSADETFKIWGKDAILSDVVRVFREFQPDVVLTRFPPDERAGHGHHTASGMLAEEAFEKAALPALFPEQVKRFGTWQAKRLYTNTGRWWNTSIDENTPGIITLNVGEYNPLLGQSYSEIAAVSRSQHKSQGFGSGSSRGDQLEFFEYRKGEKSERDLFEGINTTWSRVKGGEAVKPLVEKAIQEFDSNNPSSSVTLLFQIREKIKALEASVWRERKLNEVEELIGDCLGLFCEVTAGQYWLAPGEQADVSFEVVNRSGVSLSLKSIRSSDLSFDSLLTQSLEANQSLTFKKKLTVHSSKPYSDPYWLREPGDIGLFTVKNTELIGRPENPPAVTATFHFIIGSEEYQLKRPLVFRWTDPVKGELYRPFEIVPPVLLSISNGVWIFNNESSKEVGVTVRSNSQYALQGTLRLDLPEGWTSEPKSALFDVTGKGNETFKTFRITPPKQESVGELRAVATIHDQEHDYNLLTIDYDHFPAQILLPKAASRVVRVDVKKEGSIIGYIRGAGDDVPSALRNIGYEVWEMKNEEVTEENLRKLDAVVMGIRALNTNDRIAYMMPALLSYVEGGGTLVMQYNTNGGLDMTAYSPYPLSLSRDRVSEEDAKVTILAPEHPVLNVPNKITASDFDGWVQERGLYFPGKWDAKFVPILSMHDTGETPKEGSLVVASYGQGYYVYTGLSFFRELPEGVPGAYKLFANIMSLGKGQVLKKAKSKKNNGSTDSY